jgi:formamidopyrimidine-DNA glycosylase
LTDLKGNPDARLLRFNLYQRSEEALAVISEVLSDAIAAGGSTLDDSQYVDIDGKTGSFQAEHRVYGRDGKRCVTCGKADIVRVMAAGRATAYCPRCQK